MRLRTWGAFIATSATRTSWAVAAQIFFTLRGTKGSGATTVTISGSATPNADFGGPGLLSHLCVHLSSGNQLPDQCGNNLGEHINFKSPGPNFRTSNGTWPSKTRCAVCQVQGINRSQLNFPSENTLLHRGPIGIRMGPMLSVMRVSWVESSRRTTA